MLFLKDGCYNNVFVFILLHTPHRWLEAVTGLWDVNKLFYTRSAFSQRRNSDVLCAVSRGTIVICSKNCQSIFHAELLETQNVVEE
jgi:hypothetical protein